MLTLAAGTQKFLALDEERIQRNAERSKPGEEVAVVYEVAEGGSLLKHRGFAVLAVGPVTLAYDQQGAAIPDLRDHLGHKRVHAAYMTEGEVRLATVRGENLEEVA